VNPTLPWATEDAAWLSAPDRAFDKVSAFNPGAIAVSLGFDAPERDPFATFRITNAGFARAVRALSKIGRSALRVLRVQGGGYLSPQLRSFLGSFLADSIGSDPSGGLEGRGLTLASSKPTLAIIASGRGAVIQHSGRQEGLPPVP
jgi:acetoin utilization deacetylase AcuC-like enzyme